MTFRSAQADNQPSLAPAQTAAQRGLDECAKKLARHRAAVEAGADPVLVAGWTREVQNEQAALEAKLAALRARDKVSQRMLPAQIREVVGSLGGLLKTIKAAEREDKLEVYRQLGVKLTYNDKTRVVLVESLPKPPVGVLVVSEGGLESLDVASVQHSRVHAAMDSSPPIRGPIQVVRINLRWKLLCYLVWLFCVSSRSFFRIAVGMSPG